MIIGAVAIIGVVATLGLYASGAIDGFSQKDENVAEAAQNSITMLSNQTDDLERSIVDVVSAPFSESSEYDRTLSEVSEFIEEIQNNTNIDHNEIILAVEELNLLWSERYDLARSEYLKLEHRLNYANKNTKRYFDAQI